MRKWMEKVSRWKFDKKMQLLVTVSIIATTLIVLVVSTISSVTSMKQQSIELLQAQNSTTAENFKSSLDNYKTLAIATVMDTSIQQYLKAVNYNKEAGGLKSSAFNILASISNMHSDMNFIAVVGKSPDDYIYKGQIAISAAQFSQVYTFDAQQCKTVQDSSIKMCFNNAYFNGSKYTLNIYFPIYDTNRVLGELGLLCMNFTDPSLLQILEYDSSNKLESMVVDTDGMMISARDKDKIGTNVDFIPKMKEKSGTFSMGGRLYIYQKVSDWRFYVVSSVPMMELYKSSIRTIFLMAFILLFLLTISLLVVKRIISKVYRPLDKVVRKMDDVASGSLKTRINVEHMGEDFTKLAVGFNSMMEEILVLMEQVKMEQHQIEQIRFNALQSQIQPHFLYNTLFSVKCTISMNKPEHACEMLTLLISILQNSVSSNKSDNTLLEETIIIGQYVRLQNLRYDDKVHFRMDLPKELMELTIPRFLIQPLVENVFLHAIPLTGEAIELMIRFRGDEKIISIEVCDTGIGFTQEDLERVLEQPSGASFHIGLKNIQDRIQLLYGPDFGLYAGKDEQYHTVMVLRIPGQKGDDSIDSNINS